MSNNYGLKISKEGIDVLVVTNPKDLIFSTQFKSMKIRKTGSLVLSLPSETFGGAPSYEMIREHEAEYTHSIGTTPILLPRNSGTIAYVDGDVSTGASYTVNDLNETDIPIYGYGNSLLEWATVIITNNKIILRVTRENYTGSDINFSARTATLYYTIFFNRADLEFNLL